MAGFRKGVIVLRCPGFDGSGLRGLLKKKCGNLAMVDAKTEETDKNG